MVSGLAAPLRFTAPRNDGGFEYEHLEGDRSRLTLIQTVPGLMNAIHYLDARRAIV